MCKKRNVYYLKRNKYYFKDKYIYKKIILNNTSSFIRIKYLRKRKYKYLDLKEFNREIKRSNFLGR